MVNQIANKNGRHGKDWEGLQTTKFKDRGWMCQDALSVTLCL